MIKKLLFIWFTVISLTTTAQQNLVRCSTMEDDSMLRASRPMESMADFENWLQAKIALYKNSDEYKSGSRAVVTIPVIFHIIHDGDAVGSGENITAARVTSAITVLNNDFRKLFGTNGYNTHPAGADCEIEFCAAVVDPNGNVLTEPGVDRVNMGQASWTQTDVNATVKPQTQWDPTRYYNVWSVVFGGSSSNLLGYAQFPSSSGLQGLNNNGGSANTDGVVVRYTSVGLSGSSNAPYNLGRTLIHETGHWLGLRHIWGDSNCGNDYCNDTPTAAEANYGCPTKNSCNDGAPDPNDMVQNYMDYSNDACMNIFTNDQKTRMLTVLANSPRRASLLNSNVCSVPLTFSYTGRVVDAATNQGIANAKVLFDGPSDYTPTTDANGYFTITNLQQNNYNVYAGKWGYVTGYLPSQAFTPATPQIVVSLQEGYYDDFLFDFNWTVSTTATSGAWVRGNPVGTTYTANNVTYQSNPGADVTGDNGTQAYITGNAGGQAGADDVDGGTTTLTSPIMNLSNYTDPLVRYYRWFFNNGGSGTPDDSLVVSLVNGTQVIDIDKVGQGANSNQWLSRSYRIKDYISTPGNNIYFRVRTFDSSTGHLVEAGLDLFRIIDSTATSGIPPIANFAASATQVCAGEQIAFSDLSSNNPNQWQWTFQGGTPGTSTQQNPSVTYNTPGTFAVTLKATNLSGNNTLTQTGYITVTPVVAKFSQDLLSVCPGYSVTYTNESECNATSVKWIFQGGDPLTSTDLSPTVLYTTAGYYDVTLIATNSSGSDTLIENLAVLVYSPPTLNTTAIPDTNNTGNGSATVSVSGGTIPYTYKWNTNPQQTTATAMNIPAGIYNVTVTDGNGCNSITSVNVGNVDVIGVSDLKNMGIAIYPNPTKEVYHLQVQTNTTALLYNNLGELVWLHTDVLPGITYNIPAQHFRAGVYHLKLVMPNGTHCVKLVKE